MKKSIVFLLVFGFFGFAQTEDHITAELGQAIYLAQTSGGMLNGRFTSKYANGKVKADGTFKDNMKTGLWKLYDSTGTMRMVRSYANSYRYDYVEVMDAKGKKISNPNKKWYPLTREQSGMYPYPKLEAKDEGAVRRLWRNIRRNETNEIFFKDNTLFEILRNKIDSSDVLAYEKSSDEFLAPVNTAFVNHLYETIGTNIVEYRIKEDWVYNVAYQLSETRIIALCPVAKHKKTGVETPLFWVYYPQLAPFLAKSKAEIKNNQYVKNLEDVFHFRRFSSRIAQVQLSASAGGPARVQRVIYKEDADKIELSLFEMEFEQWMKQKGN